MHDYFDILGVSDDTPPRDIRRACARRARHVHPDVSGVGVAMVPGDHTDPSEPMRRADAAVDFVDHTAVVERMQAAFLRVTR